MQFEKTLTYQNLARSFAGECQAGMRYQMIAKAAMNEKMYTLADAVKTIAKNETVHATQFFNQMLEKAGCKPSVEFDAGYPFRDVTLAEGLRFAAEDEQHEHEDIYPTFAATAKEEGFADIADLYQRIADVEHTHRIVFEYLHKAVKEGTLFKSESPILWICSECGYMHVGTQAWKVCPLCKAEQGYVQLHLPFEGVRE